MTFFRLFQTTAAPVRIDEPDYNGPVSLHISVPAGTSTGFEKKRQHIYNITVLSSCYRSEHGILG